jgi:methionine-rich copper-binding protein CopC
MSRHDRSRRIGAAAFLILAVATLAFPAAIVAHSELESATPKDGAVLAIPPAEIVLTFDAPLNASKSSVTLHDPSGTQIAKGGVDPADDTVMRLTPPALDPGEYEIRWTSVSEDGDLLRDTLHFALTAPPTAPPTPSPTIAPSEAPSEAPTPSLVPSASPSPSPSADGTPAASTTDVLLPIVAAIAVVLLLGAWLLRNRARGARP